MTVNKFMEKWNMVDKLARKETLDELEKWLIDTKWEVEFVNAKGYLLVPVEEFKIKIDEMRKKHE